MTDAQNLGAAVAATSWTISNSRDILRYFNEPDWPAIVEKVLRSASDLVELHSHSPLPSIADDYANLASVISQIRWPDASGAADDHLAKLRGSVGSLRMDVDHILHLCENQGKRPSSMFNLIAPELALVSKNGREAQLKAIAMRLEYVEAMVRDTVAPEANRPVTHSQATVVSHFVKIVRLNLHMMQGALEIGEYFDMGLLERASAAIGSATFRFLVTINSAKSKATQSLKIAAEKMKFPIKRLLTRVRVLVEKVASDEASGDAGFSNENTDNDANAILIQIGNFLKENRLSKNLKIEDISRETHIAVWHLRNIENADYSNTISLVYLAGFVRSYLQILGISDNEIVHRFRTAMIDSGNAQSVFYEGINGKF
jgi:AraC-like DNA-binding protein